MKGTLRKKYILAGSLLIAGFMVCLLLTVGLLRERVVENWNHRKLRSIAVEVSGELARAKGDIPQERIDNLASENDVTIAIIDEDFTVLSSTRSWETINGKLGEKTKKTIHDDKKKLDTEGNSFASYFDDANSAFFVEALKIPEKGILLYENPLPG